VDAEKTSLAGTAASGGGVWLNPNERAIGGGPDKARDRCGNIVVSRSRFYYAMLLFAYAGRGSLVPIHTRGIRPWLRAFAVRGTDGEHRVILVNTDLTQNEHVRLATTGQKATILRLTAHSAESKSGLTFGGASVDPNGDWAPRVAESVTLKSDRFVVDVPAASAVVVQIHTG
jgi:hypothetical protein